MDVLKTAVLSVLLISYVPMVPAPPVAALVAAGAAAAEITTAGAAFGAGAVAVTAGGIGIACGIGIHERGHCRRKLLTSSIDVSELRAAYTKLDFGDIGCGYVNGSLFLDDKLITVTLGRTNYGFPHAKAKKAVGKSMTLYTSAQLAPVPNSTYSSLTPLAIAQYMMESLFTTR